MYIYIRVHRGHGTTLACLHKLLQGPIKSATTGCSLNLPNHVVSSQSHKYTYISARWMGLVAQAVHTHMSVTTINAFCTYTHVAS